MTPTPRAGLLSIPAEITELSLIFSHPRDVAAFAQTCRTFHSIVYASIDSHLWRELWFAQGFEDIRKADLGVLASSHIDWRFQVQRRARAEFVASNYQTASSKDRVQTLQTLLDAVLTVPSEYVAPESCYTHDWAKKLLDDAQIQDRPVSSLDIDGDMIHNETVYERQPRIGMQESILRHQLHAYIGLSEYEKSDNIKAARRTEARCFVYDLRNYTERNHWGPILSSHPGMTNWAHIDHILEVITRNLDDHRPVWELDRPPSGLSSIRPYSAPSTIHRGQRDWAGVEGKWRRLVCFMDYRDLYEYNFAQGGMNGRRDCRVFHQAEFEEATRFLYLELCIAGYSPMYSMSSSFLKPADCKDTTDLGERPTIHFIGMSKGGSGNEATVKGLVRMTREHQIRWSFVSIYDEELQWSSEGVQLGAVGSAMGVVGSWTGAHHEARDPAGPFWLWKAGSLDHCHKCGKRM